MVDWISFQVAIGVKAFKPVLELKDELFKCLQEMGCFNSIELSV